MTYTLSATDKNKIRRFSARLCLDKTLYVKKENVFGNELIRPVCRTAKLLTALTKNKTLIQEDILRIKSLGYIIKHVEVKI